MNDKALKPVNKAVPNWVCPVCKESHGTNLYDYTIAAQAVEDSLAGDAPINPIPGVSDAGTFYRTGL